MHFRQFFKHIPSIFIGSLAFQFIKIDNNRLGAVNTLRTCEGTEIVYSSKARTLMDAVYDWSRFNSLPRGYDWIRKEIKEDLKFRMELVEVAGQYGNQATARRIGYLLESILQDPQLLIKPQRQLSDSKALIPWIPGRPAKGTVNRKWGLIVNG